MTVILIYEMPPEAMMVFKFTDPDLELLALLRACHGCFINSTDDDYPQEVKDFLIAMSEEHGGQKVYDDTSKDTSPILQVSGDCEIIVAGFIL